MLGLSIGAAPLPNTKDVTFNAQPTAGGFASAIASAVSAAQTGKHVLVTVPNHTYRESVTISGVTSGSIDIVANHIGHAIISGADLFTGWSQSGDVWTHAWNQNFGNNNWPSGWPGSLPQDEQLKRVETFWINGGRLAQVVSEGALVAESFWIDEGGNQVKIKTAHPDLNAEVVEGTVRQTAIRVTNSDHIAIRGLDVEHCASEVQNVGAVFVTDFQHITLEDMVVSGNSGCGVSTLVGNNLTVRRIETSNNGYNGYEGTKIIGGLSEDCAARRNNWRGSPFGFVGWHIAGLKYFRCHDMIWRRLLSTENLTRGFWMDIDFENIVIDDCTWTDNLTNAVFLEKCQGPTLIRGLVASDNAEPGLLSSSYKNLVIEDSFIERNGQAQINWSGNGSETIVNFVTGQTIHLTTTDWTVTGTQFTARGSAKIAKGIFPPPNITASGNTCSTESSPDLDGLVCG